MTAAARTTRPPQSEQDDEITIEHRVRIPAEARAPAARITTRMSKVDERLLAIARGELDPDDPFGGLIPIYDHDAEEAEEIDESWLTLEPEPMPEGMFGGIVPTIRMPSHELFALPIDSRSAFFASQIDGKRTVEQLIEACRLDDLSGLEIIDELLRLGAIELR